MKVPRTPLFVAAAGAAALAACAPCFFTMAETILAVGRGVAARAGIAGASWGDRLVAAAFDLGGWNAAEIARAGTVFFPVAAFLLLLHAGSSRLPSRFRAPARFVVALAALGILANGSWTTFATWSENPTRNVRLLAPVDLLQAAQKSAGPVFYNAATTCQVAALAPKLLDPGILQPDRAELDQSPVDWRARDLIRPFASVVISGSLAEARPLIDLLLASPNWHLELADNQGLLFRRGAGPGFRPPPVEAVPFVDRHERAVFLAQSALSFEAVGMKTEARDYITGAINLEPAAPDILVISAALNASQGRWAKARTMAERALIKSPSSTQAASLRARALLETGVIDKAYQDCKKLVKRLPADVPTLLLHARASRAAHDPIAEIQSLEKLLSLAGAAGVPETRIRIYLGQAWTQRGFPDQALENYRAALAGRLLPGEEREVREAIRTIERNRLPRQSP